jgi:hypothetical protein
MTPEHPLRRQTDTADRLQERLESTINDIFAVVNEVLRVWNIAQAIPPTTSDVESDVDPFIRTITDEIGRLAVQDQVAGDVVRAHGLSISLV